MIPPTHPLPGTTPIHPFAFEMTLIQLLSRAVAALERIAVNTQPPGVAPFQYWEMCDGAVRGQPQTAPGPVLAAIQECDI